MTSIGERGTFFARERLQSVLHRAFRAKSERHAACRKLFSPGVGGMRLSETLKSANRLFF